jgi:hypothetical protein
VLLLTPGRKRILKMKAMYSTITLVLIKGHSISTKRTEILTVTMMRNSDPINSKNSFPDTAKLRVLKNQLPWV